MPTECKRKPSLLLEYMCTCGHYCYKLSTAKAKGTDKDINDTRAKILFSHLYATLFMSRYDSVLMPVGVILPSEESEFTMLADIHGYSVTFFHPEVGVDGPPD
jgi:hypothetical protein